MHLKVRSIVFCLSLFLFVPLVSAINAQEKAKTKMNSGTFSALKLRNIGPALMSGRIADIAIDQTNPNTWYVAAGSGNLWKTTNAGTTWSPIFDNYGSFSIGCVTIDPKNNDVVWVGTGESVGGRHVGFGDGVYRSNDGGKSFENMGLKETGHIAKILVDPRNTDVVYVAAQGLLWSKGGERGLYKSEDAGKTWKVILKKGDYTGVTDCVFDPSNPDVIYAATHQRHRIVAALINGGPESGIWKSTDAGKTWRQLKSGIPGGDLGKIALAVSPQKNNVVYASIELPGREGRGTRGGFWRSTDGGESWQKRSDYVSGGTGPHYYQEIWADPHRFDVLYQANVELGRTEDGGKNWSSVESPNKHVDNHAVAFHPTDENFVLVGCDGGLYVSRDYAKTYHHFGNLPLTQFYKIDIDYDTPFYNVVGGTQDNNTQYGPTRTNNVSGIRNSDWRITIGGDGHDCAIDPKDPNVIYCESQQGFLRRFDRRTGQSVDIRPQPGPGEDDFRFNWDAPIIISPHSHKRLYFASSKLHKSNDRGDSWETISPDLTRNIDRYRLKLMDRIWSIDANWDLLAMSQYSTISAVAESPKKQGLLYVGTDDGLMQVSDNDGKTWRKIEKIKGIPTYAFVNDVEADLFDEDTVYAAFDNHQTGDLKPYLMKSTDRGKTWTSMVGDLPDRHLVWKIIQDDQNKDLFFIGTEFGIYFTVNAGKNWIKLPGTPVIPFRDLEIQRRENDLIGASFGRGIYVLDDYTPLRNASDKLFKDNEFHMFPIRDAQLYVPDRPLGRGKGYRGDSFFTADNPPFGATFTYYLRDSYKTRKQIRSEKEKKNKKDNGDNPYPGWDELKEESLESKPALYFEIKHKDGNVVARIDGDLGPGTHRVNWNLRYTGFLNRGRSGPYVVPGEYTVQAFKYVDDKVTPLGKSTTFKVVPLGQPSLPEQDAAKTLKFQFEVGKLQNALSATSQALEKALQELKDMESALKDSRVNGALKLYAQAKKLERKLLDAKEALSGEEYKENLSQIGKRSILSRAQAALFGTLGQTYGPTQTHRREFAIAKTEYANLKKRLQQLIDRELRAFKDQLDAAGVVWTPGRPIPAIDN